MNEPTPATPLEPAPMTINEVEALARKLITVPIGSLIINQSVQTCEFDRPNIYHWSISLFAPRVSNVHKRGFGHTPLEALSNLIEQLTPCDTSTASA